MKLIKLIGNELYKIFHKKLIYILAIVATVLFLLVAIANKTLVNMDLNTMLIDSYNPIIDQLNPEKSEDAQQYVILKPVADVIEINKEKKFKTTSPEYYYLMNDIQTTYGDYYTAKYIEKDETKTNELDAKIKTMIASLDNFDWKKQIQDEIDEIKQANEGLGITTDEQKETIRILEYRLNNNIPKASSEASIYLDNYLSGYVTYNQYEKDDSKIADRSMLYQKKEAERTYNIGKYKIDNNMIKDNYVSDSAQEAFINVFGSVSIFVIVAILMISGQIVAEEYSKGTIKQLLVRPFSRTKIIVSKMIASIVTVFVFVIFLAIINSFITGLFNNSFGTLFSPVIEYNFTTKSIVTSNVLFESLLHFAAILPEILMLILFTVLMSALTGNTALSVVLGFVLYFVPNLFTTFISKVKVLSYLPFINWDLTEFLYGGISYNRYLTLPKSIIVDIVTIIGLIVATIIVFKKKEVKNQ